MPSKKRPKGFYDHTPKNDPVPSAKEQRDLGAALSVFEIPKAERKPAAVEKALATFDRFLAMRKYKGQSLDEIVARVFDHGDELLKQELRVERKESRRWKKAMAEVEAQRLAALEVGNQKRFGNADAFAANICGIIEAMERQWRRQMTSGEIIDQLAKRGIKPRGVETRDGRELKTRWTREQVRRVMIRGGLR